MSVAADAAVTQRRGLFAKYVGGLMAVVTLVLVVNGALDVWFSYQATRASLERIQQEKAAAAAQRVEQFVTEIKQQIGWTTAAQWAAAPVDQRRFDFIRLLRQVEAITELAQIDAQGREQLKVSRLAMDVVASQADWSGDDRFKEIQTKPVWYSPVYLRKDSEPYMSVSLARTGRRSGATVAEVNLKLIREVVHSIKVGQAGYAYVVDREGRLIAHSDISLVLRNTNMARLEHVRAALQAAASGGDATTLTSVGVNVAGQDVLSAAAPTTPELGWLVFVELPAREALQPLYASLAQTAALLALGLGLATLAAWVLARRMMVPIRALGDGAARLGGGDLGHRIEVKSRDEIETLAAGFNQMAERLQESYAGLEQKVEARTQELARSVDELTASGEILRLIASTPDDLQPMFQSILEHATRLCEARFGILWMVDGEEARAVAQRDVPPDYAVILGQGPVRPGPETLISRVRVGKRPVHVDDARADLAYTSGDSVRRAAVDKGGIRTLVGVPMMRQGESIGVLCVFRQEVRAFSDKQVNLLATFADQAVIAIENSRLLRELRARTDELGESLEYQTATSELLKVISRSTFNLEPVLQSVAATAAELCHADEAAIFRLEDGAYRWAASIHMHDAYLDAVRTHRFLPGRDSVIGRTALEQKVVQVLDTLSDPDYGRKDLVQLGGIRTLLGVPMQRDGAMIGVMVVTRRHVEAFTDKQIEVLQVFADQAVIAVENVRLFNETTDALERQTATADVLRVISTSPTDTQPVFEAILERATKLSDAESGILFRYRDGAFHALARRIPDPAFAAYFNQPRAPEPGSKSGLGRVLRERRTIHIPDMANDAATLEQDPLRLQSLRGGMRSWLGVPLLREGELSGAIVIYRAEPRPFSEQQIGLLETFADQAVIAIENVRLFNEIQDKNRQLELASQHKSQFLANMSHELRTPLNAVLGYAELLLDGIYGDVPDKARGVLERVQSNGKHLLGLINDVLDLSKIEAGQLKLSLDAYALGGVVQTVVAATESLANAKGLALKAVVRDGLPTGFGDERRLAQVFLNLVGNAIKFTDQGGVEIAAGLRDGHFEVAVSDTGPGIAPEDQARIFEEFQQVDNTSTRKKGGTGLGLAISRRIVAMHGGALSVESEVGRGSTFRVTLPVKVERQLEAA